MDHRRRVRQSLSIRCERAHACALGPEDRARNGASFRGSRRRRVSLAVHGRAELRTGQNGVVPKFDSCARMKGAPQRRRCRLRATSPLRGYRSASSDSARHRSSESPVRSAGGRTPRALPASRICAVIAYTAAFREPRWSRAPLWWQPGARKSSRRALALSAGERTANETAPPSVTQRGAGCEYSSARVVVSNHRLSTR